MTVPMVIVVVVLGLGCIVQALALAAEQRRGDALEVLLMEHLRQHPHLLQAHTHHMGGGKFTSTGGPPGNVPLMRGTSVAFTHVTECSSRAVGDEGGL